jgi:hypothetical protein
MSPAAAGPIPHWRLVPFDNNIAQRNVAPVPGGGGASGLSAAYEHHLSTGKVSPYVGGIVGTALQLGTAQNLALYLGGLLGAEVQVLERVALFAEYGLIFRMDEPDFFIDLGIGNNAQLGVIIYLQ